ncbi:hypothetical protein M422DRAFT_250603 [Sphaerobolus stellatus SS14]|uniref:Uncharacterized protein n=1 Tax=Sphaerobolus stellatus (strain SS14) TaxID=990650 RepID=A0A0C9VTB3_SPHS4|nr:hypothetical protein M422DRAFT_250603 [Sphaerobolus stellatus SS14]
MSDDSHPKRRPGRPPKKRRPPRALPQSEVDSSDISLDAHTPVSISTPDLMDKQGRSVPQIAPLTSTETLHIQLTLAGDLLPRFGHLISLGGLTLRRHAFSSLVDILWFGHPIDSPHDPRARQFLIMWKEPSELSDEAKEFARKDKEVVCRWNLLCAGICGYDVPVLHGAATAVQNSSSIVDIAWTPSESPDTTVIEDQGDILQEGAYCNEKIQLVAC